jgi:hypothetical protein
MFHILSSTWIKLYCYGGNKRGISIYVQYCENFRGIIPFVVRKIIVRDYEGNGILVLELVSTGAVARCNI